MSSSHGVWSPRGQTLWKTTLWKQLPAPGSARMSVDAVECGRGRRHAGLGRGGDGGASGIGGAVAELLGEAWRGGLRRRSAGEPPRDVTDRPALDELAAEIAARHGRLDVLKRARHPTANGPVDELPVRTSPQLRGQPPRGLPGIPGLRAAAPGRSGRGRQRRLPGGARLVAPAGRLYRGEGGRRGAHPLARDRLGRAGRARNAVAPGFTPRR